MVKMGIPSHINQMLGARVIAMLQNYAAAMHAMNTFLSKNCHFLLFITLFTRHEIERNEDKIKFLPTVVYNGEVWVPCFHSKRREPLVERDGLEQNFMMAGRKWNYTNNPGVFLQSSDSWKDCGNQQQKETPDTVDGAEPCNEYEHIDDVDEPTTLLCTVMAHEKDNFLHV